MSKRTPTPKQKRVIDLIIEDSANSKKEIMEKAGYSKAIQTNPSQILESKTIKKGLETHRDLFEGLIRDAEQRAKETVKDAKYRDVVDTIDKSKKHLNIIDGINNEQTNSIIVIPGEIVKRYDVIEGEIIDTKQIEKKKP